LQGANNLCAGPAEDFDDLPFELFFFARAPAGAAALVEPDQDAVAMEGVFDIARGNVHVGLLLGIRNQESESPLVHVEFSGDQAKAFRWNETVILDAGNAALRFGGFEKEGKFGGLGRFEVEAAGQRFLIERLITGVG
jgi:hypothetical protein